MALKIKYIPTPDLVGYENNPRTHSPEQVEQIIASINEFGFTNPILVDETKTIIAGHGRLMAAKKLGLETVPTITLVGLTDDQKKAYVIADNKLALNAEWNIDLLVSELQALVDVDFDIELTGFDFDFLKNKHEIDEIDEIENVFEIVLSFENEHEQQCAYEKLKEKYQCRILNM